MSDSLKKAIDNSSALIALPRSVAVEQYRQLMGDSWHYYLLFLKEMREEEKRFVDSEYAGSLERKLEKIQEEFSDENDMTEVPYGVVAMRIREILER